MSSQMPDLTPVEDNWIPSGGDKKFLVGDVIAYAIGADPFNRHTHHLVWGSDSQCYWLAHMSDTPSNPVRFTLLFSEAHEWELMDSVAMDRTGGINRFDLQEMIECEGCRALLESEEVPYDSR